ncbi:hypothetical protein MSG28_005829 [Choristoneura fumiferana]|uniref:Uncharacterized protein n=2 Tax=Choristoneura fumiferana TaxID=7141 RepID=A0ACC0L1I0_CHOFU|nr:hypothetical protein MSG28_005829 [Choristoneura fumiferana]
MQAAEGEPPQRRTPKKGTGEVTEERRALHAARGLLRETEPIAADQTRVVSRGSGATPLALLPPRRATHATPAPTPVIEEPELDIMQLPIVFADDELTPPIPAPAPVVKRPDISGSPSVTVTSGHPRGGRALNYTRVIVAKRRGGGAARGAGGARPVLLRRTVRLVQKGRPH